MRYILAFLLCYSITITKGNESNNLFKKIVTGGNKNATLGQVIAGYKKIDGSIPYSHAHIGIRIPRQLTTSVDDVIVDLSGTNVFPNPTSQENVFYIMNDVKYVELIGLNGKVVENAVDLQNQKITLPYRGVFYIKFITQSNQIYSSRVIYN